MARLDRARLTREGRPARPEAPGDELLRLGIERCLKGTVYLEDPSGYARLAHPMRRRALPRRLPEPLLQTLAGVDEGEGPSLESLVAVDIESLGFIGRPLFLVGAIHGRAASDGLWDLELVQYLARDYAEEEAVLAAFGREAGADLWLSFNGRTFDLPFLELRAAFYRLPAFRPRRHLDLLPVARRCWGELLPDCRLKTLEQQICGRARGGLDIESGQVPEAYHRFVATGDPRDLLAILGHNAADLISLVDLLERAVAHASESG